MHTDGRLVNWATAPSWSFCDGAHARYSSSVSLRAGEVTVFFVGASGEFQLHVGRLGEGACVGCWVSCGLVACCRPAFIYPTWERRSRSAPSALHASWPQNELCEALVAVRVNDIDPVVGGAKRPQGCA